MSQTRVAGKTPTERAWRRLYMQLDQRTPVIQREVFAALKSLGKEVSPEALARAIQSGDIFTFRRLVRVVPQRLALAAQRIEQTFFDGVTLGRQMLPGNLRSRLQFNATNPAAVAQAALKGAEFVTNIDRSTRLALRDLITRGQIQQIPTRELAPLIKEMVGLNARQGRTLFFQIERWYDAGYTASEVRALTARLKERMLKQRALMIARTENAFAASDGVQATWKAARREGLLSANALKKWLVTPDDRLCVVCRQLDGLTAPLDGMFSTRYGPKPGPPAHPNCRCAIGVAFGKRKGIAA